MRCISVSFVSAVASLLTVASSIDSSSNHQTEFGNYIGPELDDEDEEEEDVQQVRGLASVLEVLM